MTQTNVVGKTASAALPQLCGAVLDGEQLNSRAGWVREQIFTTVTLTEPWRREILTPGRKADVVAQIAETLWVLAGRDDVEWLSAYLPRAKDFSDDGETWRAGYGPRIRGWSMSEVQHGAETEDVIDQLAEVVRKLSTISEDRRAVINLWDPAVDNADAKDIPCNNWLHFLVRNGKLHLHVATRSNDLMWGWSGINAFEWSALQELVASMVGAEVGELHFAVSSMHLYQPYWGKATRLSKELAQEADLEDSPRTEVKSVAELDDQLQAVFELERLLRSGQSDGPGVWSRITDPMLRSWAQVLAWHWTKDEGFLGSLRSTRLYAATREVPARRPALAEEFAQWASQLHAQKHEVYGDSWKKRGEQVSIQANIARKIDRLGKAGAGDTELDTTTDLLVYLVKYGLWLAPFGGDTDGQEHVEDVRNELLTLARNTKPLRDPKSCEISLAAAFDKLIRPNSTDKDEQVEAMAVDAFALALHRYTEEKARIAARDAALQNNQSGDTAPTGLGATHAARNAKRSWNPDMLTGGLV